VDWPTPRHQRQSALWEDASVIIRDNLSGASAPAEMSAEADRRQALSRAIREARDDDTILVAGNCHEA
jgi:UDP-N-acetylmuramyl tripeptide synthase